MADWSTQVQEFADSLAASVAVVGHDEGGALVVSACNESFFNMTGGRAVGIDSPPIPFDAVLPSYARHEVYPDSARSRKFPLPNGASGILPSA